MNGNLKKSLGRGLLIYSIFVAVLLIDTWVRQPSFLTELVTILFVAPILMTILGTIIVIPLWLARLWWLSRELLSENNNDDL